MNNAPFESRAFRQALGTFTTGVTIITTRDAQQQPVGLTANSFNSVSLDPPMVLWSLARTSRSLPAFEAAEHFAVHILSIEQEALSNRFASRGEDKFAGVAVEEGVGGLPMLSGCTTRLQCKTSFRYEGGDHIIFVGVVLAFDSQPVPPLVFHAGGYAMATRKPPAAASAAFGDEFLGFLLSRAHFELYARVQAVHLTEGVDEGQFFLLTCLLARNGQRLVDVNRRYQLTGHLIEGAHVQALAERGLLQPPAADSPLLWLTPFGRERTLYLLAAMKAIESELLAKLGEWETLALKSLLRQLQQITSAGLPDPWAEVPEPAHALPHG